MRFHSTVLFALGLAACATPQQAGAQISTSVFTQSASLGPTRTYGQKTLTVSMPKFDATSSTLLSVQIHLDVAFALLPATIKNNTGLQMTLANEAAHLKNVWFYSGTLPRVSFLAKPTGSMNLSDSFVLEPKGNLASIHSYSPVLGGGLQAVNLILTSGKNFDAFKGTGNIALRTTEVTSLDALPKGLAWNKNLPQYTLTSSVTVIYSYVPEPGTWAVLAAGAFSGAGLLLRRRRKPVV